MRVFRSGWVKLLGGLLALSFVAAPAQAETKHRVQGGQGIISNGFNCPVGHYIVGFRGYTGSWIDYIRVRCAPLLDGGGVGKSKAYGGVGGGGGGENPGEKCGSDYVVSRIKIYTTPLNRQIKNIEFWCISPDTQQEEGIKHSFGNAGGDTGGRFTQPCEYPEAAHGVRWRWGDHLNAIGLTCDTLRRP